MITSLNYLKILEQGQFDQLIGQIENDELEFKREPYQLNTDRKKIELAKDISALANNKGGLIVIGIKASIIDTHPGEQATEIRAFNSDLIDETQYMNVIRDWIYPEISEIKIKWHPDKDNSEKGLFVIYVPDQPKINKPFLIKRTIDESENRVEIIFGYIKRQHDRAQHIKIEQLHSLLKDGNRFSEITDRLESIENTLIIKKNEEVLDKDNLKDRVNSAIDACDLINKPQFIISAQPMYPKEIYGLFSSSQSKIVQLIESPPRIRNVGFNLDFGQRSKIILGNLRRVVDKQHQLLELWKDGTLIFCTTAGTSFLSWGSQKTINNVYSINPMALSETVYVFCLLLHLIHKENKSEDNRMECTIQLCNLIHEDSLLGLKSYGLTSFGNIIPAPNNDFTKKIFGNVNEDYYEILAFNIISSIYEWFGHEHDTIPYTSEKDGKLYIDKDKIIEAGK